MHTHLVIARLKTVWPDPAGSPTQLLPAELLQCERLWKTRGWRRWWKRDEWIFVRKSLEPLLRANIELQSVHRDKGLLNCGDLIEAEDIELHSANFKYGPIPAVTVYAYFQLILDRSHSMQFDPDDWIKWDISFILKLKDGIEYRINAHENYVDFGILPVYPKK